MYIEIEDTGKGMDEVYMERLLWKMRNANIQLLQGKFFFSLFAASPLTLCNVSSNCSFSTGFKMSDDEKRACQRKLFEVCIEYLNDYADYCVFDVSGIEKIYDIGFLYCDFMSEES
mgnify:CR=1 FL=1